MMELENKVYELKFNLERVKLVEGALKTSLMGEWVATKGMLPLQTLEMCFQICLKESGADVFVGQTRGVELFQTALDSKGYAAVALEVQESLQKTMPFLFQAG